MNILEFGDTNKRKIILIHGFQQPWQIWNKYVEHYKDRFHIIVPVMSGHNPDDKENFISFETDAKKVEEYIISRYGKDIYAMYGISMGGVLGAMLWQNNILSFNKVIFDGAPLVSLNRFMKYLLTKFYVDITHKAKRRDRRIIERATKAIIPKDKLNDFLRVLDNMSDLTIKNSINGVADFRLRKDIDVSHTTIYFFHGTAFNETLSKASAKRVIDYYPTATIRCFKGKFHCENVLFYPEVMIDELDKILI